MSNFNYSSFQNTSVWATEFHYQAKGIQFSEWITLLTLCLAPLITHLIAGAPRPVYLHHSRPRWHDRVVHYNPTSIIWRYFGIIDRRIRARNWTDIDMVAGNSLLWTDHGWDGSEQMILKCRDLCIQEPSSTLHRLLTTDSLKTLIISLQGAQAIYILATFQITTAMDSLFVPLALIGLVRLPAAPWLTDDRLFLDQYLPPTEETSSMQDDDSKIADRIRADNQSEVSTFPLLPLSRPSSSTEAGLNHRATLVKKKLLVTVTETNSTTLTVSELFHPAQTLRGISIRLMFSLFFMSVIAYIFISLYSAKIFHGINFPSSLSGTMNIVFYAFFMIKTFAIFLYYFFVLGSRSSTIIPCIGAKWYKAYTGVLYAAIVAQILVAALETRKTLCGTYTTLPGWIDRFDCWELFRASNGTLY